MAEPVWLKVEMGQTRLGGARCRSRNVRNAPLARADPKKAACREGPLRKDSCTAANNPHSITSSARVSSKGAMVRPSPLADLRLITSSNRVGCWTGKSAGLAPFSSLAT
jgi:hypothetical protein